MEVKMVLKHSDVESILSMYMYIYKECESTIIQRDKQINQSCIFRGDKQLSVFPGSHSMKPLAKNFLFLKQHPMLELILILKVIII